MAYTGAGRIRLLGDEKPCGPAGFREIATESFKGAVRNLLGEKPLAALLVKLQSDFQLSAEEICEKADELSQSLRVIFGQGGPVVERVFLQTLFGKLGMEFEPQSKRKLNLKRELDSARKVWERKGSAP